MENSQKLSVGIECQEPLTQEVDETEVADDEPEEEDDFEGLGLKEKMDWSRFKTIFRYRPKTVDEEGKLTEEDIYNIMRENRTNPYLAAMLASMSLTVYISRRIRMRQKLFLSLKGYVTYMEPVCSFRRSQHRQKQPHTHSQSITFCQAQVQVPGQLQVRSQVRSKRSKD